MLRRFAVSLTLAALLVTGLSAQTSFNYPKPRKVEQVDDYHGVQVSDPYRWMEDSKSADLASWIDSENKITDAYLSAIPERDRIKARLTELWNYERYSAPGKIGNHYVYSKNADHADNADENRSFF